MNGLDIFKSSTLTPSMRVSSRRHPVATLANLGADADSFVTRLSASVARVNLDRMGAAQSLNTRSRRSLWVRVEPAMVASSMAATREPLRERQAVAVDIGDAAHASRDAADTGDAVDTGDIGDEANIGVVVGSGAIADVGEIVSDIGEQTPAQKPPSAISRVELTIDSLRNYELVRPIPVIVESLGDRHLVAEVPDLNISTSASSSSEILISVKDRVTQLYDGLRIKKTLDMEQTRQLRILESYIGKSRRGWLDRR